jgi:serine/tyrosine/threonine adenylyltransferase
MQTLSAAIYKREFVDSFPGDHSGDLTPRPTPGVLYSKAIPTAVKKPELLAWSQDLAETLGLQEPNSEKDIEILGGNFVAESMYPYAA